MTPINEEILGHTIISPKMIQTYRPLVGGEKLWVAKILGIDKKFGFQREFVNREESSFMPEHNIVFFYLKAGGIYQYTNVFVEKGVFASGFIAVLENEEELLSLTKDQVRKFLGMPVKDWKIERVEYASDDVDF
jgi:hypothetical protein